MQGIEGLGHLINFTVDKETCIGCRACAEAFPAQFQMDDDANKAYTTGIPAHGVDPYEPVIACPVDSISIVDFKGRLLLAPQPARDRSPFPDEGVAQMVKDYEALPPEQRPVIEVKTVAKPAAGGTGPGGISDAWLSQFASPAAPDRDRPAPRFKPWLFKALRWTAPVWGGFSERFKSRLLDLSGDPGAISPGAATTFNGLLNFILYPAVAWSLCSGRLWGGTGLGGTALLVPVLLAVIYGGVELLFRLKDEVFDWGITERDRVYNGAVYFAPFSTPMVRALERLCAERPELVYDARSLTAGDPERERLYGRAVRASRADDGVQLEFEFPSMLRLSSGEVIQLPDYTHDVAQQDARLLVRAWVADPGVEQLWSYRDPFPLGFEKEITFPAPVEAVEEERLAKKLRLKVRLKAAA